MKRILKVTLMAMIVLIMTTVVYAATKYSKNIEVYYGTVQHIVIDGIDKTPTDKLPFVYEGTTYVPIRYVSESLGKEVSWEGSTGTIFIGKNPAEANYLTDKKVYSTELINFYKVDNSLDESKNYGKGYPSDFIMTMNDIEYAKGIAIHQNAAHDPSSITYNINGEYKKLKGIVGYDDRYMDKVKESTISFYVDDELKETIKLKKGDLPKEFEVDLDYGMQLKIVMSDSWYYSAYLDFVDMVLE